MTYLTPREVSLKIGLKYSTVLEWAKVGILPARIIQHRRKSKYFFVEKEVEAVIERHRVVRIK
ncbi:MAG: helix-turn-helix domain-containing protein [Candidatus Omnitrophica bacterium]|nr:helix-turn-helix domain-containing protein [Candidatus Omnitrophota bacterium]